MEAKKKKATPEGAATQKSETVNSISRHAVRVKRRVLELLFHLVIAALAAFAVATWAVPAAYAERGYAAIGGEWLLVIMTFIAVLYFAEEARK